MLQLATDENFNGDIVRGLLFRLPDLNLVRVRVSSAKLYYFLNDFFQQGGTNVQGRRRRKRPQQVDDFIFALLITADCANKHTDGSVRGKAKIARGQTGRRVIGQNQTATLRLRYQ